MKSQSFQLVLDLGFTSKLNRHEEMMSISYEEFVEPLVSNGSNYASWSIHVLNHLRTLGPHAERVVVASILPSNLSWYKTDWKNQSDLD